MRVANCWSESRPSWTPKSPHGVRTFARRALWKVSASLRSQVADLGVQEPTEPASWPLCASQLAAASARCLASFRRDLCLAISCRERAAERTLQPIGRNLGKQPYEHARAAERENVDVLGRCRGGEEATPDHQIEAHGEDRSDRRRQEVPRYVPLPDLRGGEIPRMRSSIRIEPPSKPQNATQRRIRRSGETFQDQLSR